VEVQIIFYISIVGIKQVLYRVSKSYHYFRFYHFMQYMKLIFRTLCSKMQR